ESSRAIDGAAPTRTYVWGSSSHMRALLERTDMLKISPKTSIVFGFLALAATSTAGSAKAGISLVLPPAPFRPAFETYSTLAAGWWEWALTQPASTNPILDTTGANCGVGQSGLVFYLAGNFGGSSSRTCTVPYGKTIVFPILNGAYFAFT